MTIRERILFFLDNKSISKYRFYKDTGISNGFLDKEGSIGSDKCVIICSYYPEINPEWLLLGAGAMLKPAYLATNIHSSLTDTKMSVNELIEKVDNLIAENENLKSEIDVLKSYRCDYNNTLGVVAESKIEYASKPTRK